MSIKINNIYHTYQTGTPYESNALSDVEVEIQAGEFIGLIGHTGSGKSTLVQHLNGLLKPTKGNVTVDDLDTSDKKQLKLIRQKVGLVFQYPEHQLFEETIFADIAFGPKNLGLDEKEINIRVKEAMKLVGFDYEKYKDKSPFMLSGGQKRKVAIAGVLAMKPKYLVLDEPTAGLDPKGREEILAEIKNLHERLGITVILVSHSMDDVARFAQRILVMHRSKLVFNDNPENIFQHSDELEKIGLGVPSVVKLMQTLKDKGWKVETRVKTIESAREEIIKALGVRRGA